MRADWTPLNAFATVAHSHIRTTQQVYYVIIMTFIIERISFYENTHTRSYTFFRGPYNFRSRGCKRCDVWRVILVVSRCKPFWRWYWKLCKLKWLSWLSRAELDYQYLMLYVWQNASTNSETDLRWSTPTYKTALWNQVSHFS